MVDAASSPTVGKPTILEPVKQVPSQNPGSMNRNFPCKIVITFAIIIAD